MRKRYGDSNWQQLTIPDIPEAWPRRSRYGDDMAVNKYGMVPVEDKVDVIDWNDLKEVLAQSHEDQSQPMYHQNDSWAPRGEFRFNQNGIGYCWTFSGTACMMDLRAVEGKKMVPLSAVSMGWLVRWKNQGNYLESFIEGVRKEGVAPVDWVDGDINSVNRNPRTYKDGWETERKKYRLSEIWDTDARSGDRTMILHCATILALTGRPLYCAWNWWGHAVECCGMLWDESEKNNVIWLLRNSHNELDLIELSGSRGVPDEAYGFSSSVLA